MALKAQVSAAYTGVVSWAERSPVSGLILAIRPPGVSADAARVENRGGKVSKETSAALPRPDRYSFLGVWYVRKEYRQKMPGSAAG